MRHSLLFLFVVACTPAPFEPPPPPPPPEPEGPARVCRSGKGWAAGQPAFVEHTSEWGLSNLNIRNFAVGDLDGDGWADLAAVLPDYKRGVGRVYLNREANGRRTFVLQSPSTLFASRDGDSVGRLASMLTLGDVDNDGDLDAYMNQQDYPPAGAALITDGPDLVLNDGKAGFQLGVAGQLKGPDRPLTTGLFFFDPNLDGKLDLAVGYWWVQPPFTSPFGQQPQLFSGDGAGVFRDITAEAGLTLSYTNASVFAGTNARPLFGLVACDVNGDGREDIVGAAYGRFFNELFIASADGHWKEEARLRGVASDDRIDYTDDDSYRCYCQQHAADAYCAGAKAPKYNGICAAFGGTLGRGWYPGQSDAAWSLGGNTFSHVCADFDNDGDLDLYETNIRHPDTGSASDPSELLINDGTGMFKRPGRETMGLTPPIDLSRIDEGGQQGATLDFDGDGRLDVMLQASPYPQNRGWLFRQRETLQFEYVGKESGYDPPCPSGIAIADFDHDGDEDFVTGTYGCGGDFPGGEQPTRYFENVASEANWVSVKLVGLGALGANRAGLGARVRVTAGGVTQTRVIHGSWGQGAMSRELTAFFGLGEACDIESIEVRWPNGELTTQTFTGVVANHRVELREGDAKPRYLE